MALYKWEGKTSSGEARSGVLDAPSTEEVENRLQQMGLTPTTIKKKAKELNIDLPFLNKVDVKTKVVFTRQLATMIDAGLPLVQCLEILGTQEPNPKFQKVILSVKATVEGGSTFSDALGKHPKIFDNLFVSLVSAGELGGILDTILNRLAIYIEKAMKLKQKVKGAMKYPLTVLVVSITITMFLLTKVIPSFAGMFTSMGKELPALTSFMVQLSADAIENFPSIVGGMIGFVVALKTFRSFDKGAYLFDNFLLNMPVIGDILKKAAVAKFTRTLGTLISSGVPILDALDIVAKTAGNLVIEDAIIFTRDRISEGKSIVDPLREKGIFPSMVVQMIGVGEQTGAMDIMLNKIADFYEDEVDQAVDGLTSLLEPLIMVVLGGIIGTVLLSMYLPIFSMADGVG
jgi:type IV pilus assembly protein PilC